MTGASSYRPYEPLFGYGLESFAATIVPGDVREIRDGAFNMTHAASLVFPDENGVEPFARISVENEDVLKAFLGRGEVPWRRPAVQEWLNGVSVAGVAVAVVAAAWPWRRPGSSDE